MARALNLLIVDDDPGQATLIRIVVRELELPHQCHHACNGMEALNYLRREHPFESAERPDLILLDLNMPGMNGCEVLRVIKTDPELQAIPVIVLSSSRSLRDVAACYTAHANAYIHKPMDLEGNMSVVRELDRFWSGVVVLTGRQKEAATSIAGRTSP